MHSSRAHLRALLPLLLLLLAAAPSIHPSIK